MITWHTSLWMTKAQFENSTATIWKTNYANTFLVNIHKYTDTRGTHYNFETSTLFEAMTLAEKELQKPMEKFEIL